MSFKSTRRAFIGQGLSFTALNLTAPQLLAPQSQTPKILVVIELTGGNDGLNTVVPFTNEIYKKARPHLAIGSQKLLPINEELALHPSLREIADLYEKSQVAIINGVGYENSSRSHFEAMDVWQSGAVKEDQKRSGWLGRYLDIAGDDSAGVVIGDQLPLALASSDKVAWVAGKYDQTLPSLHALYQNHEFIAPEIMFADVKTTLTRVPYPQTELAQNLQATARLIANETKVRVFYVRLDGFDTHENQPATHPQLLATLSGAIAAFYRDLKEQGKDKDVLTLTFSEFGRSVSENSRGGTDHGAANCLFAIGAGVRGGVYGVHLNLNDLENGALKPHVDFRQVYATVLERWLGADSEKVLRGRFKGLDFV